MSTGRLYSQAIAPQGKDSQLHVGWTSEKRTKKKRKNLSQRTVEQRFLYFHPLFQSPHRQSYLWLRAILVFISFINKVSEVFMAQQLYSDLGLPLVEVSKSQTQHNRYDSSAHHRALYLITHNTQKRHTSMPLVGFEPATPVSE